MIILGTLILVLTIYLLFTTAAQHREDLGQLTSTQYVQGHVYCDYKITAATPEAGRYYQNGAKLCIECCSPNWPPTVSLNRVCPSRITFKSSSGLVTYEAEAWDADSECTDCSDGSGYYLCP